jgi:hypothetical protein
VTERSRWVRLILWARGRPHLAAYLFFIGVNALAFWTLSNVVQDNEAQRCVNSWESRAQIREAIPIPGEAIIEVAPDADPAKVEAFRAAVDRRIRETFPNPDCNLEAARRRLGD